ncbi:MAG: hypothetical protein ACQEQJ_09140 [Halobacteriota archaeon]
MDDRLTGGESAVSLLDRPISAGVATGAVHAVIAASLWTGFGFEGFGRLLETEPAFLAYILSGMVLLGAIPGVCYATWRSVAPALLIGGSLCLSAAGTWAIVRDGLTPVDPTPFGWYVLLWVGIAVVATAAGLVEHWVRQ